MINFGKLRAIVSPTILSLAFAVTQNGCGGASDADLVTALPGIDRPLARHLAAEDDSTLVWYARSNGIYPFRDAGAMIITRFHADSPQEFLAVKDQLLPVLRRIATVYRSEFASGYFEGEVRFWSDVAPDVAVRLGRLRSTWAATLMDTTKTASQKAEAIGRLIPEYESIGYLHGAASCKHEIGNLLAATDKAGQLLYYRRALVDAERADMYPMICQILGTLGHEASETGHTDSMFYYWNRSLGFAEQHKLPDFSARIYEFYADHYRTEGRLAVAHDLYTEAQTVCRRYKGGYRELRCLVKLIEFYNELGCWEITGRLLQRAEVLESQVPENPAGTVYPPKLRAQLARARYLMAMGQIAKAEGLLNEIKPYVRQQLQRDQYPRLLYTWSRDLLQHGRTDDALPLIEEGLARTEEVNFPLLVPMFYALLAELEYERGQSDAALAALASFESATGRYPAAYQREWITRDVIKTRLMLERGDADGAVVELSRSLSRLEGYLSELDASTHGYLWLNQRDDVRRLLHEFTRGDAVATYGAELYWCGLYRLLGAPLPRTRSQEVEGLLTDLRRRAADAQQELHSTGRTHIAFHAAGDGLCRITATPQGVRHDEVDAPLPELRRLVSEVWGQMSDAAAEPEAEIPRALITPLRALALQLLPNEVLETRLAEPRPLLVTATGFLASLPFETLNLAADGSYRPLLSDWDVAYLRCATPTRAAPAATVPALLVADPALSERTRRRLSMPQALPGAAVETADIAAFLDEPVVLAGTDATKARVIASWENASLLYVAAHFLANPEVPYLTMLPLAQSGDEPVAADAALLDIGDVRASDFRSCRLVVLSGCATGAPYVAGGVEGPGFADAFLDAGAAAVVHTFWTIRDATAAGQLSPFVRIWAQSGVAPDRALSRVRREQMAGPNGIRHPYYWAAFGVKLGRL